MSPIQLGSRRRRSGPLLVLAGLLAVSCAAPQLKSYKLYPGPERPAEELAIVELDGAWSARFDGMGATRNDWHEVHLLAGEHLIEWEALIAVHGAPRVQRSVFRKNEQSGTIHLTDLGFSPRDDGEPFSALGWHRERVTLKPGHHYRFRKPGPNDGFTRSGRGWPYCLWDAAAEEYVAGPTR
jgi:hypothetical protein